MEERVKRRLGKALGKNELNLLQRYEQEKDEVTKKGVWFKLVEKLAPKIIEVTLKEFALMNNKEFAAYCEEQLKPMMARASALGKEYLRLEVLKRDPFVVFAELRGYEDLMKRMGRIMNGKIEKRVETKLLRRFIILQLISDYAHRVLLSGYKPLFEVLNIASNRLQVDENWAITNVALDLEENLLKKKLVELGVSKRELVEMAHEKMLDRVATLVREKEGRQVPIDLYLSPGYRKIRNLLKHEGYDYKLGRKETLEIVNHVMKLNEALWPT